MGIAAEHFDFLFDLVEFLVERADQRDAAFECADGILEGQFAGIDFPDDLFEVL